MAFPTRHWRKLQGTITQGAMVTIAHGLRDGMYGTLVTPDVVTFEMGVGNYSTWANQSTGKWQADNATNVYLSNWDPANAHLYSVVARSYWKDDSTNM